MILEFADMSSKNRGAAHVALPSGLTLGDIFEKDEKLRSLIPHIVRVDLNAVERTQFWKTLSPEKNDKVVIHILPKDPATLTLLSQIGSIISAVVSVVRFFISLFSSPKQPKGGGGDRSPTYSFEGIRDSFPPSDPIPVVYGRQRKGGQVLMYNVSLAPDLKTQSMKLLLGMCEGPIGSMSAIELNNIGINNFQTVSYTILLGTSSQGPINGFTEIANTFFDGREISNFNANHAGSLSSVTYRTSNNNVTAVDLQVLAPDGVVSIGKHKGTFYTSWTRWVVEFKKSNHDFWTVAATLQITGATQSPLWSNYKLVLPSPDEYDIRLTWIDAHAHPKGANPGLFSYRVSLQNVTEYTGAMPVYSSTALLAIRGVATQELQGGRPNVTAIVHGRNVKNFYTPSSYEELWSNNPAWAVRDYLTNSLFGMGAYISDADINIQSFLDFATLANSDIVFCAESVPSPEEMAYGQVFCSKNAETAIQGDRIQNQTSILGPVSGAGRDGPPNVFKLMSREDGKPRYGLCYVHDCCPPFGLERYPAYAGPYGANSPDVWCDQMEVWGQFMGTGGGGAISGFVLYARSGTVVTCGTAYAFLYNDTVDSPFITFQRYNSQDMRQNGTLIKSQSIVLTPGSYISMNLYPDNFDVDSGYAATRVFLDVCNSEFGGCISIVDTKENTNRIPQNHDGLVGVLVQPSSKASDVYGYHQWGNWADLCDLCYSNVQYLDLSCVDRPNSTRAKQLVRIA